MVKTGKKKNQEILFREKKKKCVCASAKTRKNAPQALLLVCFFFFWFCPKHLPYPFISLCRLRLRERILRRPLTLSLHAPVQVSKHLRGEQIHSDGRGRFPKYAAKGAIVEHHRQLIIVRLRRAQSAHCHLHALDTKRVHKGTSVSLM